MSSISNSDLTNIYENKKEIYKHQKICHYNGNIIISAVFNPRSVPDNIRSYAFGLQFVFQRTLGFIPGPIIYGWLFDTRCLVWAESCGRRGNCQFYDVHSLSYGIMLLAGSSHGNFEIRFLIHFYLFMFYLWHPSVTSDQGPPVQVYRSSVWDGCADQCVESDSSFCSLCTRAQCHASSINKELQHLHPSTIVITITSAIVLRFHRNCTSFFFLQCWLLYSISFHFGIVANELL